MSSNKVTGIIQIDGDINSTRISLSQALSRIKATIDSDDITRYSLVVPSGSNRRLYSLDTGTPRLIVVTSDKSGMLAISNDDNITDSAASLSTATVFVPANIPFIIPKGTVLQNSTEADLAEKALNDEEAVDSVWFKHYSEEAALVQVLVMGQID